MSDNILVMAEGGQRKRSSKTVSSVRLPSSATTRAAPSLITAVGGITPSGEASELLFVAGDGGAVTVTASPQVAAGSDLGQLLYLKGTHATDSVTLANGNGLELNGLCVLKDGSLLVLMWDGTIWGEVSRNDI